MNEAWRTQMGAAVRKFKREVLVALAAQKESPSSSKKTVRTKALSDLEGGGAGKAKRVESSHKSAAPVGLVTPPPVRALVKGSRLCSCGSLAALVAVAPLIAAALADTNLLVLWVRLLFLEGIGLHLKLWR